MCERRKEILFEWATEQINKINEMNVKRTTSALFRYQIIPTSVGSEITVICPATENKLDLSLIDDEEW
jgi:hypothetical protein